MLPLGRLNMTWSPETPLPLSNENAFSSIWFNLSGNTTTSNSLQLPKAPLPIVPSLPLLKSLGSAQFGITTYLSAGAVVTLVPENAWMPILYKITRSSIISVFKELQLKNAFSLTSFIPVLLPFVEAVIFTDSKLVQPSNALSAIVPSWPSVFKTRCTRLIVVWSFKALSAIELKPVTLKFVGEPAPVQSLVLNVPLPLIVVAI